ncbi:MAG: plastocyanin [Betaproteobacteria bacterium]|nr:MAG: plastocyanin [Betaproteobacteria bacterium]
MNNPLRRRLITAACAAAGLLAVHRNALAHGDAAHGGSKAAPAAPEQQDWGIAGEESKVDRTIAIEMSDHMRFTPDHIDVRVGETIRFTHHNRGQVMHEMVIGTPAALQEHAALMERFPEMEHDEPWMAHVAPGARGEMIWHFNRAGEFEYACLIPGHYQAGMRGTIRVRSRTRPTAR